MLPRLYKRFVILALAISTCVSAQVSRLDSLKGHLRNAKGSDEVDCMNNTSKAYYPINTDSAYYYATAAFRKAGEEHYWKGVSDALNNMGSIQRERGNLDSAEVYFRDALSVSGNQNIPDQWCRDNLELGYLLFLKGHFSEGTDLVRKSLDYYVKSGNETMEDFCYRLLGNIYSGQGFYEKAFFYLQKGLAIGSKVEDPVGSHSSTFMWNTYLLGELYNDAGDYATALDYYNLSLSRANKNRSYDDYYKISGDVSVMQEKFDSALYYYNRQIYFMKKRIRDPRILNLFISEPIVKIGEIYLAQKNYDTALKFFSGRLPTIMSGNMNNDMLRILMDMSKVYLGKKNWSSAYKYATELKDRAESTGTRQYLRDAYELYWRIFDGQGKTDSAYKYYRQYGSIRDSIAKDVQLRNIAVRQMKLWKEKQDIQIQLLKKEKKIRAQQTQLLLYSLAGLVIIGGIVIWNIILKRRNAVNRTRHLEDLVKLKTLEGDTARMEFEHKTAELEMQALRAQMNPHFIFNSLNAINRFILENNKEQASAYLTTFSRLVRMILHHSQANLIPLESELESLRLYLELEALRFDDHFTWKITVDPSIETTELQVAPLIIQPYAENAIWHGLMHKEEPGTLLIDIRAAGDILYCRIIDDGIGRKKAAMLKSKSVSTHKSMGMRITSDRIARMNEQTISENSVRITDIVFPDGEPGGTEVILKIPMTYA